MVKPIAIGAAAGFAAAALLAALAGLPYLLTTLMPLAPLCGAAGGAMMGLAAKAVHERLALGELPQSQAVLIGCALSGGLVALALHVIDRPAPGPPDTAMNYLRLLMALVIPGLGMGALIARKWYFNSEIKTLSATLARHPRDAATLTRLGVLQVQSGEYAAAQNTFRMARDCQPDAADRDLIAQWTTIAKQRQSK